MAAPKIFTLVDGNIAINKIEVLTVIPFKEILKRDNTKIKEVAFKELAYVYHIADPRSLANMRGMKSKEAHETAISIVGLPSDYRPDKSVTDAIIYYKAEMEHAGSDVVLELLKTFRYNKDVIEQVRKAIGDILSKGKLTKDQASEVLGLIETTIKLGKSIPTLVRDLNKAISEFSKNIEDDDILILRGTNEPVPQSMNFDEDYR